MLKQIFLKKTTKDDPLMTRFRLQLESFSKLETLAEKRFVSYTESPQLNDNTGNTFFDGHYIYHPAWAARIIKNIAPAKHIDISSTLHFCTQLSAFIPVEFYDYRPANIELDNLVMGKADLTNLFFASDSIACISCMHTVEHIGLGRYGDPLDPDGDLKAIEELKRVTSPGGHLLFVVPVGKSRLVFNAHRIYSYDMIVQYFSGWQLRDFSLVDDAQQFHNPATASLSDEQQYGCGCFWWQKPGA
ncbi:MAG TPA: DUF268 domain-containing protein [Phnomibacter sp.]|nr:DUF268 domain-containing protein [Phnomibacter sp.]